MYLQTNHIGLVLQNLLDNQVLAVLPGERLLRTTHKAIVVLAKSWGKSATISLKYKTYLFLVLTLRENVPLQQSDILRGLALNWRTANCTNRLEFSRKDDARMQPYPSTRS